MDVGTALTAEVSAASSGRCLSGTFLTCPVKLKRISDSVSAKESANWYAALTKIGSFHR